MLCAPSLIEGQEQLAIGLDDVRIDESVEGGYLLTIRKRDAVGSVLLTESTRNPNAEGPAYSYYTRQYSALNGNERRILDGVLLDSGERYYLTDSTPELDDQFGEVFRIFIPYVVNYGFSETRDGEVSVRHGTFINIRSFELPFNDYRGAYRDNPYLVSIIQALPGDPLEGSFTGFAVENLSEIAARGDGEAYRAADGIEATQYIEQLLQERSGQSIDIALVLDTTRSMRNDINQIKQQLPELIDSYRDTFKSVQLGLTLYRDYKDEYLVRAGYVGPSLRQFDDQLQAVEVDGGGDIPEAVFEALYEALDSYPWQAEARLVILVADAPPHPLPRGEIDAATVFRLAARNQVAIHTIILPR